MHQLPALVWNQLAAEQPLLTPMANRLLPLDQDALDHELDKLANSLRTKGTPSSVITAYLSLVIPFWEAEAVAAFRADHPQWAGGLPEVLDLEEAAEFAARDRPMTFSELEQFQRLLQARPK